MFLITHFSVLCSLHTDNIMLNYKLRLISFTELLSSPPLSLNIFQVKVKTQWMGFRSIVLDYHHALWMDIKVGILYWHPCLFEHVDFV